MTHWHVSLRYFVPSAIKTSDAELMDHWLSVAANLRVDRSKGVAPHKPCLLLVVADLIEEGKLTEPLLPLTGELTFRFMVYWSIVAYRRSQKPDFRLPFYQSIR